MLHNLYAQITYRHLLQLYIFNWINFLFNSNNKKKRLTPFLLSSSADSQAWSGSKLFDTLIVFLKELKR